MPHEGGGSDMKHPSNRAERRHERERVIAARKFVWTNIWQAIKNNPDWAPAWGRYAKWNMNCGCMRCHSEKYFSAKRKRRDALKVREEG